MKSNLLYQRKGYTAPLHRNEEVVQDPQTKLAISKKRYARSNVSSGGDSRTGSPGLRSSYSDTGSVPSSPSFLNKTAPTTATQSELTPKRASEESELEQLRSQKKALVREVEILENQLKQTEIERSEESKKRIAAAAEKVVLAKQVDDLKYQLSEVRKAKTEQESLNNSKTQRTDQNEVSTLRAELSKLKRELENTKRENQTQKGTIASLEKTVDDREIEIMELTLKHEQASLSPPANSTTDTERTNLVQRVAELEALISKLQTERTRLQNDIALLTKKSQTESKTSADLQDLVSTLEAQSQTLKDEIHDLCERTMEKELKIDDLTKEKTDLEELRLFEQEEMKELVAHCEEVETDVAKLDLVVGEKKVEIEILDRHNQILVDKLMDLGFGVEVTDDGGLDIVEFG